MLYVLKIVGELFKNDLKMHPSGRNQSPTQVVVDESSKSPLLDGGRQFMDRNEQMGGNEVTTEEP